MLKINKLKGSLREVEATEGYVTRKGEAPGEIHRMMMCPSDTLDNFEEVLELPPYTKAQYDAKVGELVRERYTENDEFAVQRKYLNSIGGGSKDERAITEYVAYNAFVEECKAKAKDSELYKGGE